MKLLIGFIVSVIVSVVVLYGSYGWWRMLEDTLLAPPIEATEANWGDTRFFAEPDYIVLLNKSDKTLRYRPKFGDWHKSNYDYIPPRETKKIRIGNVSEVVIDVDGYWSDLIITIDRHGNVWRQKFD